MSLVTEGRGSFWPVKCREAVAEATYNWWNFTEAFTHNLTDGNHSVTCFLQVQRESPRFCLADFVPMCSVITRIFMATASGYLVR